MTVQAALVLFRRLGVDPGSVSQEEFRAAYYRLAKRYHPDINPHTADRMANINAARSAIWKSWRQD
jgi:DnaJ-class molecular chaperone